MAKKLKDKKIIIYKPESYQDSIGQYIQKWKPIHPGNLWAYVRQLSQSEFYSAGAAQVQEERFFVINWRNDVNTSMNILYKGKWYMITRVDPYEDYKGDLQIYVKEAISGHIPNDEDILPYEDETK